MEFKHQSVLLSECMESLNIRPDGIYVDGTLGGGGHSYEICRRLSDKGRLIGIDQDEAAIENYTLQQWTEFFWTWGSHPISWITRNAVSLTGRMPHWICGWIRDRK